MNAVNHPQLCLHLRCCWLGVQCTWYSICLCLHNACGRQGPRCNDLHTHTKGRVLVKPTLSTAVILHQRASSCPSVERDGGVCVCATACLLVGREWFPCWRTVLRVFFPPRWVYNGWINSCPPTAHCSPCVLLDLNSKGIHVELFTKINKFAVTEARNFTVSVYIKSDKSQIL